MLSVLFKGMLMTYSQKDYFMQENHRFFFGKNIDGRSLTAESEVESLWFSAKRDDMLSC